MTDQPPAGPPEKPTHACDLIKEGPGLTCPAGLPVPRGTVLARRTLRSVAFLVLLALLVAGANLLWTSHAVNAYQSSQRQQAAAQQHQGAMIEAKLCQTLDRLAALRPPAGNPRTNPSRAFDQQVHATLDELGPDIGCKRLSVSERDERLAVQGPRGPQGRRGDQGNQGNQGNRGEQGKAGLSVSVRRALVFLFVLNVALAGANLLWTAHEVRAANQARCGSVVADATIPLAATGAARTWEARFETVARQRARQLACG